ncbi:hypothetical protein KDL44_08910 [bacterium]|nr:hypothetical protein [bacterium]
MKNHFLSMIIPAVLLGLLCGCPADAPREDGTDNQGGPVETQPSELEAPKPANTDSSALQLNATELKLGQRIQLSIPESGSYLLKLLKTGQDANGKVQTEELDSFEPVSGPDSSNGWLPESTGKFTVVLLDSSGTELDREKFSVAAWPKGDPVAQQPPFVSINVGEVTEDMLLKVGLPIVAYFQVPDDFPHDSWIGLFRVDGNFEGSATADDAVESALLSGNKGQFTFFPKEPGRYVVRLFASYEIPASHVGDSQEISVVLEYEQAPQ